MTVPDRSESLAIVLTPRMLDYLRELPSVRALHMLREIAAMLRKHAEPTWPAKLDSFVTKLEPVKYLEDPQRVADIMREILAGFDGPDSLRNLRLSREAGHKLKADEVEPANARLGAMTMDLLLSAMQTIARVRWAHRGSIQGAS